LIPFHIAKKKVPHLDTRTGEMVSPTRENAIKFERFVFDMLPAARAIVVEVDRQLHFAPLKNAAGAAKDTPESVQAQMMAVHRQWLRDAGARVGEEVRVEISPLWSLDAEGVRGRLAAGTSISADRYFA
jgi:UDP-N-acetylglucosamine/UDP-N-acetylgalactosamine diphosphorylase